MFGAPQTSGASVFTAGLILAIMVVPIIASVSRDLFLTVPRELQDGAAALGATRWEIVRGVVLPSTASGVAAAACLGLGRALGEAIAVTQVIGAGPAIHALAVRDRATRWPAGSPPSSPGATSTAAHVRAVLPRGDPAGHRAGRRTCSRSGSAAASTTTACVT